MTKVLVTGGNGQLALTLKELFSKNNYDIVFTFVSKSQLDISDKKEVESFFANYPFDYCVNCAAYTNVEQAEKEPESAFKINSQGVENLAKACKKNKVVLIHISTDYVFDGLKGIPYTEDDKTNPINEYGKSKLAGERQVLTIMDEFFIIRTSWLYSIYGKNFLKTIIKKIKENQDMKVIMTQKGSPTSCIELANFIYSIIFNKNKEFGIYHFSSSGEATWFNFAKEIASYYPDYNSNKVTGVDFFKTLAERPVNSILNNSKRKSVYPEIVNWKLGLKQTIKPLLN